MSDNPSRNERADDKDKAEERPPVTIKPVKKKIGEPPGNLRRREQWYQRRSGGRPEPSAS